MNMLVAAPRSFIGSSFTQSIRLSINPGIRPFIAALLLMFAANAHAAITVGLGIENGLDINGDITVINGSKVKVAYEVLEDTDNDLNKKDRIELRTVDGDELVSFVLRGKKKSGSVSLKVKNSEGEQLYVRYVRKTGTEIARTSHPADPGFIALLSIPKVNLADLTIGLNALTSPVTRYYVVGINDFVPYATTYTFLRNDHKLNPTSAGTQFFFAPVHLPDGATVTAIDFYTTDISNTAWISWYMSERRQSTGAGIATIADAQGDITGTPGKENLAVSGLSHVVDNSQYYYQMRIYFSDGSTSTEFHSARITYQVSRPD